MDYKGYLYFVLATENRHQPQALRYLFKFLDIKNQGYLDSFTINYFSRVIYCKYCYYFNNNSNSLYICIGCRRKVTKGATDCFIRRY